MRLPSFTSEPTGLIGPESMQVLGDRVSVNGCWHRTFFVKGFPREAEPGFLAPLLCHPGQIDVSIHVVPVPNRAAIDRIKKQRGRHESTVMNDAAKGRITDPEVVAAASDAADLMSALATGESRIFLVGIYVTARAWDEEQLDDESSRVEGMCASLGLDLRVLRERRTAALTATLPIAVDPLQMYRPMDTRALAACFPFVSAEIGTKGGVLYGRNTSTGGLVLLDRFGLENYNQIVLAHSGKGKSYFAKLQVLRSLYEGIEAIVVDPENEYERLADSVGGTVVRLGTGGSRLNPLDLGKAGEADAIVHQSLFVHSVVECLVGKVPQVHKAALDQAILDAYASSGITTDPRTHMRPAPLLAEVVANLRESGGESLARRLEPFVSGSHRGLFDAPTSVQAEGHLIVLSLRDVAEELKPAATLMVLESIWRRVTAGERKRRIVIVDPGCF